ncbi:MAG: AMP-binding protein [Alphaproteobacteria bacterium]|nr:AMP-binding protein [Alphaproteobacteria bacterium]
MTEPASTLAELIAGLAARGERVAVRQVAAAGHRTIAYGELAGRATDLAHRLAAHGVVPGEAVLIWAPNSIDWLVARMALVLAGAVGVALDELTTDAELPVLARHSGAHRAFVAAANVARLAAAAPDLEILVLEAQAPRGWAGLPPAPDRGLPAPAPSDPVAIVYTSGTTGQPKSFALSHANIIANVRALSDQKLLAGHERVLLPLPLHHVYPLTVGIFTAWSNGCEVVLPESVTGADLVRALKEGRCTIMLGVPRLYAALVQGLRSKVVQQGAFRARLFEALLALSIAVRRRWGVRLGKRLFGALHRQLGPDLWLMASGGAKFEADLIWTLEGLGWETLSGYGLAETASILTNNHKGRARIGSEGWPLAGAELRIARPDPAGEGEIEARGPSVFAGYRDAPELNAQAFTPDGWFRTGDLGRVDADGYVWVTGRVKEMIVLGGGKNVYPEELEKHYAAHPGIAEIAVLERAGALVALVRPDLAAIAANGNLAIRDVLRVALAERAQRLAPHQRLAGYAIARDPLPRTRLGKIRRFELARLYEAALAGRRADGDPAARPAPTFASDLQREVFAWLCARHPGVALDLAASPQLDLGIDSLGWITLGMELQARFGIALREDDFAEVATIGDLLRLAELRLGGAVADAVLTPAQRLAIAPPSPLERALGAVLWAVNGALMRLLFRLRVEGDGFLPGATPYVVMANHVSDLDPLLMTAALGPARLRRLWWSGDAGRLFENAVTARLARAWRAFPVRESATSTTLAFADAVLAQGDGLVWFPESWRSPDGRLQEFRPGLGHILARRPVTVVPAIIVGAFEAMPRDARLPRLHRVVIRFGAPIPAATIAAAATPEAITALARKAMLELAGEGRLAPA